MRLRLFNGERVAKSNECIMLRYFLQRYKVSYEKAEIESKALKWQEVKNLKYFVKSVENITIAPHFIFRLFCY